MEEIKIEKNVPIPELRGKNKYPFKEMKVGNSFAIENKSPQSAISLRVCASNFCITKGLDWKFQIRTQEKEVRIWRTK